MLPIVPMLTKINIMIKYIMTEAAEIIIPAIAQFRAFLDIDSASDISPFDSAVSTLPE